MSHLTANFQIQELSSLPSPLALPQQSPLARQQLPNFTCFDAISSPFLCQPSLYNLGYGVDDALANRLNLRNSLDQLYPIFFCNSNTFLDNDELPSNTYCKKECVLVHSVFPSDLDQCTSCALVGTNVVYDCRNLLLNSTATPDDYQDDVMASCASKNIDGECGDYVHWSCVTSGLGYSCQNTNRRFLWKDIVFPFDDMLDRSDDFTIYCTTDITGLSLGECENPACLIGNPNPIAYCDSCTVLKEDTNATYNFAYDCGRASFQTWDLECPILDETGVCQEYIDPVNVSLTVTNENVKGIPASSRTTQTDAENDKKWTWTIRNIDPMTLNVLADIFGFATRIFFGIAFASLYPLIVTWQLDRYHKPIQVNQLGVIPGDVVQQFLSLPSMAWTPPAIAVALLLFVVDFSHTIAMFGFDFIDEATAGPMDTILEISTTTDNRNTMRSFISAGDPEQFRTDVLADAIKKGDIIKGREQTLLWEAFFRSVGAIARAASPFVQVAILPKRGSLPFGGFQYDTTYMTDDSPIVAMATEIPLLCESRDSAVIEESNAGGVLDVTRYNTALIPNCTLSGIRTSGVFRDNTEHVEIVEKMSTPRYIAGIAGDEVQLKNGDDQFYAFVLEHEQRQLARDRDDWKKGRILEDVIDGVKIGNETIAFGRVVLASGNSLGSDASVRGGRKFYSLFAEIAGVCPDRPSGHQTMDTQCLAIVRNECDSFPEDTDSLYNEIYAPIATSATCDISEVTLIWGRNFVVDGELVSVVAGIYGQVRPTINELRPFEENAIPAALFSLGTVQLAPTVATTVRAEVNMQFIVFLLVPIALGIGVALVAYYNRKKLLPIPQTPWELMVVGKEEPNIPSREKRSDPFPEIPDDLVLYFFPAEEDIPEGHHGSRVFRNSEIETTNGRISLVDPGNISFHSSKQTNKLTT